VGTIFGLLVNVLPGPNKKRQPKLSWLLSLLRRKNNPPGRLVRSSYLLYKSKFGLWFAMLIWP